MTPKEIIQQHANNQGLNPEDLANQMRKFLEQPRTKMVADGDCLFLIRDVDGTAFFYIVNGGSPTGYVRSLKSLASLLKKMQYKKCAMRVADKEQSQRIAKAAGAQDVKYKNVGGKADPYLMTMEL